MRNTPVLLLFCSLLCAFPAHSQNAAQQAAQVSRQAAQQAMQASERANRQAMRDTEQANRLAMQQSQAATWQNSAAYTRPPKFLLRAGTYPKGTLIRLRDRTPGAVIHYTTDGWTPTVHSHRYIGPIALIRDMTLQAIAVAKYYRPSRVLAAHYKVRPGRVGGAAPATSPAAPAPPSSPIVLPQHTPVQLAFTKRINSKTAQIGDRLPLVLARNLVVNRHLIASRGTPAVGMVTAVNANGFMGKPGEITFHVTGLQLPGKTIPLVGQQTKQGSIPINTIRSLSVIPAVGISAVFVHGKEAVIPAGAVLTAHVARTVTVTPSEATGPQKTAAGAVPK